jgi:hypothetical protein
LRRGFWRAADRSEEKWEKLGWTQLSWQYTQFNTTHAHDVTYN